MKRETIITAHPFGMQGDIGTWREWRLCFRLHRLGGVHSSWPVAIARSAAMRLPWGAA